MSNLIANRRLAAMTATIVPPSFSSSSTSLFLHSTSSSSSSSSSSSTPSSSSSSLSPSPSSARGVGLKSHIVGIVGAGKVGAACASSLIESKVVGHILMADVNEQRCRGEVMDLQDEAFITGSIIEQVKVSELNRADIIVITAGAAQKPGETRLNLIDRNVKILQNILKEIFPLNPSTIIMLVSNPVDILTEIARRICSPYIPANQVIGSGTFLDSQRLRVSLAKKTGVSITSIHALIIGEHGDKQVLAQSSAMIGGEKLTDWPSLTPASIADSVLEARTKAYEIIKLKGSTSHGIGACVASLCRSIVFNEKKVLPISVYHRNYQIYMGWPTVLGSKGAERIVNINLNEYEAEKIKDTVSSLKKVLDSVKLENSN